MFDTGDAFRMSLGVDADLDPVERDFKRTARLADQVKKTVEDSLKSAQKLKNALTGDGGAGGQSREVDKLTKANKKLTDRLEQTEKKLRDVKREQRKGATAARQSTRENVRLVKAHDKLARKLLATDKKLKKLNRERRETEKLNKKLVRQNEKLTKQLVKQRTALDRVDKSQRRTRRSSDSLVGSLGRQLAVWISLAAILTGIVALSKADLTFTRLNLALEQAVGSAPAAAREYEFVSDQVERLGLELVSSAEGFTKFAAATRGTELEGEQTRQIWLGLVEAGTALQLTGEQVGGALLALTQISSKGKLSMEEMHQIAERIPGAFQIAARAVGVADHELLKLVETGGVLSKDFLPLFANQLREELGGKLERAMAAPQAQFQRLENQLLKLKATAGAELNPALADLARTLAHVAGSDDTLRLLEGLGQTLGYVASVIERAVQGWGPFLDALQQTSEALSPSFSLQADTGAIDVLLDSLVALDEIAESFRTVRAAAAQLTADILNGIGTFVAESLHWLADLDQGFRELLAGMAEKAKDFFESPFGRVADPFGVTADAIGGYIDNLNDSSGVDQIRDLAEGARESLASLAESFEDVAQEQLEAHNAVLDGARATREYGQTAKLTEGEVEGLRSKILGARKAAKDVAGETERLIAGNLKLAKAYDQGRGAIDRVSRQLEAHTRLLKLTKGDLSQVTDQMRDLVDRWIESERVLEGSKTLFGLREQAEEQRKLIEAFEQGLAVGDATAQKLERERQLREQTAKASVKQRGEIKALSRELSSLQAVQQSLEVATVVQVEAEPYQALVGAALEGAEAFRTMSDEIAQQDAVLSAIGPDLRNLATLLDEIGAFESERDTFRGSVFGEDLDLSAYQAEIDALKARADELQTNIDLTAEWTQTKLQADRAAQVVGGLQLEVEQTRVYNEALQETSLWQKLSGQASEEAAKKLFIFNETLKLGTDATDDQVKAIESLAEELFSLDASNAGLENLGDSVLDFADSLAGIFDGLDGRLASLIRSAANAFSAFQALQQTDGGLQGAAAGAAFGGAFADFTISSGIFDGDRGVSAFGGRRSGDYADKGGQIGGAIGGLFGPVVGAWAGAIGTIIGGLINKGAEEALVSFEQMGDELVARFDLIEGDLEPAAREIVDGVLGMVHQVETLIGSELTTGEFGFKIRDDEIIAFINGYRRVFEDIESATLFIVDELLRTASFGDEVGQKLQTVLKTGTIESPEELQYLIEVAQALDRGSIEARPYADAINDINAQFRQNRTVLLEHGLTLSDAIRLQTMQTAALRDQLLANELAIGGVTDYASQIRTATTAFEDYTSGVERQRQAILDEIAAREAALPNLREQAAEFGELGEVAGDLSLGIDGLIGGLGQLAGKGWEVRAELGNTERELEQLRDSLAELSEALDEQALVDKINFVGAEAGLSLIDLIRQVRGENALAAEEQKLAALEYRLTLASHMASLQTLLAVTDLLDQQTRSLLEGLVDVAAETLAGLDDGTFSVPRSGGRSSGYSDNGAAQREQRRRELRDEFAELSDLVAGVPEKVLEIKDSFAQFHSTLEEAARLGLPRDLIEQARRDNVTLTERAFLEPIREVISGFNETDADRVLGDLGERYADLLDTAFAIATEKAEAFGISLEEAFAPLKGEIQEAFSLEIGEGLRNEIERLLEAGDASGLEDLAGAWDDLVAQLADTPDLLEAVADLIPELTDEIAAALEEARERVRGDALDNLATALDLDDGKGFEDRLQGYRDALAETLEILEEHKASEEELARAREMGAEAIANLIEDELDRFAARFDVERGGANDDPVAQFHEIWEELDQVLANLEAAEAPADKIAEAMEIAAAAADNLRRSLIESLASDLGVGGDDTPTIAEREAERQSRTAQALQDLAEMGASWDEIREVLEISEQALANLREEARDSIRDWTDLADGITPTGKALRDIEERADQARKDFEALGLSLDDVERGAEAATKAVGLNLAKALSDMGVAIPGLEEALLRMEFAMKKLEVQAFAAAVSADEFAEIFGMPIEQILAEIDAALDAAIDGLKGGIGDAFGSVDISSQIRSDFGSTDEIADFLSQLRGEIDDFVRSADDLGLEGPELELQQLTRTFEDLKDRILSLDGLVASTISDDLLSQIEGAYAKAWDAIIDAAKDPLRDLRDELLAVDARVAPEDAFLAAQREFQDLSARAAAGDLQAIDLLDEAGRAYADAAEQYYGEGLGIQRILRDLIDGLDAGIDAEVDMEALRTPQERTNDLLAELLEANDPVVARLDRSNYLLEQLGTALTGDTFGPPAAAFTTPLARRIDDPSAFEVPIIRPVVAGGDGFAMPITAPSTPGLRTAPDTAEIVRQVAEVINARGPAVEQRPVDPQGQALQGALVEVLQALVVEQQKTREVLEDLRESLPQNKVGPGL